MSGTALASAARKRGGRSDAILELTIERQSPLVRVVGRRGKIEPQAHQARGVHTRVHRQLHQHVADHETRARQQHERQGQLAGDESTGPSTSAAAAGAAAPGVVEDIGQVCLRGVERRHESERD